MLGEGTRVCVHNYRGNVDGKRIPIYKELPEVVYGVIFKYYNQASKLKVIVEGFTNKKSKYGCYYFPKSLIFERASVDKQAYKKQLWSLYTFALSVEEVQNLCKELSEMNLKAAFARLSQLQ